MLAANSIILDGLTFSNGCTTSGGNGGGVAANTHSGLIVRNCLFVDNRADLGGGGLSMPHGVVSNCVFRNNYAKYQGGGLRFFNFDAYGMTSRLIDCTIIGNTLGPDQYGTAHGGGGAGAMVSSVDVVNCVIVSNSSPYAKYGKGGGLFKVGTGIVRNCLIYGNDSFQGGGIFSSHAAIDAIENCTIADNKAYDAGGGVRFSFSGSTVRNSIIISNTYASVAHPNYYNDTNVETTFLNCNAAPLIIPGPSGAGINSPACADNISADPLFASAATGDYRLTGKSPCLNKGIYQPWMDNATDLYGNPRLDKYNEKVDIGCHEYIYSGTALMIR